MFLLIMCVLAAVFLFAFVCIIIFMIRLAWWLLPIVFVISLLLYIAWRIWQNL